MGLIIFARSAFLCFAILASSPAFAASTLTVSAQPEIGFAGKYLLGIHFVYSSEKDSIYRNGKFAEWARRAGITIARFPGGTVVKYWDWRDPTGVLNADAWDRSATQRALPSEWMSLDEYLEFVRISGIKPLIGVNVLGGVKFNRKADGLARAAAQVRYLVDRGQKGVFYYLGNEDIGDLGGLDVAAKNFVDHAKVIKKEDPSAKLIWNDNAINSKRLKRFLSIAGKYVDGVEFHGKWPSGDRAPDSKVFLRDWQAQYPIYENKRGTYSYRIASLKKVAIEEGFPNLLFANNEYGISPISRDQFVGFNRFHFSLVVLDILTDLFVGQFDMAAFWSNVPASKADTDGRKLMDFSDGLRLNPMHFGFEMLASAQGKRLLSTKGGSASASGFAIQNGADVEVFLMNKSDRPNDLEIQLSGTRGSPASASLTTLHDTPDHWGAVSTHDASVTGNRVVVSLPALSFSKIKIRLN
jgi:hypothetical protein